ncbi:peptide deformylase [Chachezhania sediminis]|uniref:peptide deformylase n=1 Tax=Chachezhania sediminis TaxID=2599291 RepID=UPI00131E3D91|nr:peptide deformylase [Chachezhania sediminis]
MPLLPILFWPDERLSQPCAEVADPTATADLVADMFETMYAAPGRGLAGPQVGRMLRLFVMDTTWKTSAGTPVACINPVIVAKSDQLVTGTEACLSIPGVDMLVPRSEWIDMEWMDVEGQRHVERLTGFDAICAQHEYDHLDGIVIFDRLPDEDRARKESAYEAHRQ